MTVRPMHAPARMTSARLAGADREVAAPGRQRRQLQERAVAVQQQLDALPRQQLAARPVAVDVLLATAGPGLRQQPVQLGEQLQVGGPGGPVGLGVRVQPAREQLHANPLDHHGWLPEGNHAGGMLATT